MSFPLKFSIIFQREGAELIKYSSHPNYYFIMVLVTGDTKQYVCFLAKHVHVNRGESKLFPDKKNFKS